MNRAERRERERLAKTMVKQMAKKPTCHLHGKHTEEQLEETRGQIREFLKTYDFKGSNYEPALKEERAKKEFFQSFEHHGVIRLVSGFTVMNKQTGEIIQTDVFLVKKEKGWFITYEKLNFQQNLLVSVRELGFEMLMSNRDDVGGLVEGHAIPLFNRVVRQAFDSLTLKYEDKWVA